MTFFALHELAADAIKFDWCFARILCEPVREPVTPKTKKIYLNFEQVRPDDYFLRIVIGGSTHGRVSSENIVSENRQPNGENKYHQQISSVHVRASDQEEHIPSVSYKQKCHKHC